MLRTTSSGNLVSVRTPKQWNRVEFFTWLDTEALPEAGIPHVTRLAELAEISPSTMSYWRSGKQRPTQDKLAAIAKVLGVPRGVVWLRAGIVEVGDVSSTANETGPAIADPDAAGVEIIQASTRLGDDVKQLLIKTYREDRRREREEAERKLRQTVELMESVQS